MITQQQIKDNIPQLALQQVMENQVDEIAGSAIYCVQESWQKAEVQKHPEVTVVMDAAALEEAVAGAGSNIIYIPADAQITQAITRSILQRNSLSKQIIWEID